MRVPRNTSDLDQEELRIVRNQIEFKKVVHKMQIFQREVMHFTNNLEYYIKNSALKKCCLELKAKLRGLHRKESLASSNPSDNLGEDLESEHKDSIDMAQLIKLHKNFQS